MVKAQAALMVRAQATLTFKTRAVLTTVKAQATSTEVVVQ
jgi:hypothetical protein